MCTYVHQKIRTRFAAASKGPGDKLKVYQQNERNFLSHHGKLDSMKTKHSYRTQS